MPGGCSRAGRGGSQGRIELDELTRSNGFVRRRFNRLAWSASDAARPSGILSAGMENGELALYDPSKMLQRGMDCSTEECVQASLLRLIDDLAD